MADLLTLILAAGKGTRMKSDLTKVLHPVAGKAMVKQVIDTVANLNSSIITIVGHQAETVKKNLRDYPVDFVKQENQLGTAHAVKQAQKKIKDHQGPVLILCGDTPLLTEDTIYKILEKHQKEEVALTVLTAEMEDPTGYGRIIRDDNNRIVRIVEEDDASVKEKEITEINSGVYCFDSYYLDQALENIDSDNNQGEYYLTDAVSYINRLGEDVIPVKIDDREEIVGVNDRVALARAEKILRERINTYHQENGVTIIDPNTTYIDKNVEIEKDTIIYPFTYIEGNTKIKSGTVIGPHSRLVDTTIGNNVELKSNSNIWQSEIKANCTIGPFAYIRPGCIVEKGAKIGDYVELKKAKIGEGSKVPHLSYVGDAVIGKDCNVGAGTIFANYDGREKHQTILGDNVFIGSNTTLVAPVKVGDGGKTGAGSVVVKNVDNDTVVVGVPARKHKKNK